MSVVDTMLDPPPPWTNQRIVVYHGTLDLHARVILKSGIDVATGQADSDFGRGFYTTTVRRQAEDWAWRLARRSGGVKPAVLQISIERDELARLETLSFVRGDRDAEDFWSLVAHCRSGADDHGRVGAVATPYYDVVMGPVAAFWEQRASMHGADQLSFHTRKAEKLLNSSRTEWSRVW